MRRRAGTARAFTLIELLVVIGIVAVLTGIAASFLGRVGRSLAVSAFRGRVSAAIRAARTAAVSNDSRSLVEIAFGDAESGQGGYVRAVEHKVVGMWHLEIGRATEGARENDLTIHGKWEDCPGRIGGAQRLGRAAYASADSDRLLSLENGGSVQAWVFPEVPNVGGVIVSKGRGWKLEMDGDGRISASVRYQGGVETVTSKHPVNFHRWSHVELGFDRKRVEVLVNGIEEAVWAWKPKDPEDRPPELRPDYDKPLTLGAKSRGFQGRLDHVIVSDLGSDETHWAPQGVQFYAAGTTTPTLQFAASGGLDPRHHLRAETIALRSTVTGKIETIRVGLMGDIR